MKTWIPIALAMTLLACGGGAADPDTDGATLDPVGESGSGERAPRLLGAPGDAGSAPAEGDPADALGLRWTAPEHWIEEAPENSMRVAQYRIPDSGEPAASVVVFYFGPGQGGAPEANIERWARQFAQPDGSDPVAALTLDRGERNGFPVWRAEIVGTYDGGMAMMGGRAEQLENWMLLAAIVETGSGPWFFKATGPRTTMEDERAGFEALLDSLES